MQRASLAVAARHWGCLLGLLIPLSLAGCANWTNPAKPSSVFADEAAACSLQAAQAAVTSGQFDLDPDNAYVACLRRKGWVLWELP